MCGGNGSVPFYLCKSILMASPALALGHFDNTILYGKENNNHHNKHVKTLLLTAQKLHYSHK